MRKKILGLILCLCLSGVAIGCGDKEDTPVNGSVVEQSESDERKVPDMLQSLLGGESTPEPTPEPDDPSFTLEGTQIDGGEVAGLTWVFTDAGELVITGEADDAELQAHFVEWSWYFPWHEYAIQTKKVYMAFSGASNLSEWFFHNDMGYYDSNEYHNLLSVDMRGMDTSNVTDMENMFYRCKNLTSIDLSSFDTSNVTNMDGMFFGCTDLSSIDLSNLDTSNVTNMGGMFSGCSSLTSIDLSNFDTSNVMYMNNMFDGCRNLRALDLTNFNTRNVTSMWGMFEGCESIQEILVGDDWLLAEEHPEIFDNCGVDKVTYK